MSKNKIIWLILFILFSSAVFALPYDMILVGDPVLEDLLYLSRESGNALLSFTPPVAPAEVEMFLSKLDITQLQPPAQEAYRRVQERLIPDNPPELSGKNFSLSINILSTTQAIARFNTDISWYPERPKIPAQLSFPVAFYFSDYIQFYIEPLLSKDPKYFPGDSFVNMNFPFSLFEVDTDFPFRAFAAAGGAWWNFQLGRDRLFYGTGHTGSLSISDNPDYYEFARLSFFSDILKYSLLVNHMPFDIPDDIYAKETAAYPGYDILKRTTQRYFYLHRLDFTVHDIVSIAFTEGLMVGNSSIELRYLNPLMIFHSFYSWWKYDPWTPGNKDHMTGSFFSFEANWNIMKKISLYGQFCFNEFAMFFELDADKNQPPNGMGFMAGINYVHSFTNWASEFFIEFAYTLPYTYMNPSPFASLIQNISKRENIYYLTGYPRDTITCTAGTKFFQDDVLSISGELSWTARGEHAGIVWDWDKTEETRNEVTPTGTAEHKFVASVGAQWKPLSYLTVNGSLAGIAVLNNEHKADVNKIGGQASLSVCVMY